MAELTWLTRERPILEAIDARTRSARSGTRSGDIGKDAGLDELEIDVALRDLEGRGRAARLLIA